MLIIFPCSSMLINLRIIDLYRGKFILELGACLIPIFLNRNTHQISNAISEIITHTGKKNEKKSDPLRKSENTTALTPIMIIRTRLLIMMPYIS